MRLKIFSFINCCRRSLKRSLVLLVCGALLLGYYSAILETFKHFLRFTSLIIDVSLNRWHSISMETVALNKCPVCFGVNITLCSLIRRGVIQVKKNYPWAEEAEKNVMYGKWGNKHVAIKSLGRTVEYKKFDRKICESASLNHPCNLRSAVWRSFLNSAQPMERAIKDILDCPSDRFIKKVTAKYGDGNVMLLYDRFYLLNTLRFNQEPLLLQIFPSEEGWPFPKYHGACGRIIVVEDSGKSLNQFLSHPWTVRAQLAINLLKIAQQLTSNKQDWGLYMLDASLTNFAVSDDGTVKLIDVEHLIVVDLTTVSSTAVSAVDDCDPNKPDCLTISPADLCRGAVRDLNYLAVCKGVLADYHGRRGLLHSVPKDGGLSVRVTAAIENCLKAKTTNRSTAVRQLLTLLTRQS